MLEIIFNYLKTFGNLSYHAIPSSTVTTASLPFTNRPPFLQHFLLPFILLRRSFEKRRSRELLHTEKSDSHGRKLLENDKAFNIASNISSQQQSTDKEIRLVQLEWNATRACLSGSILVHNIAFEKAVTVRYTCNDWKTWEEVEATYHESVSEAIDKFKFLFTFPPSPSQHEAAQCCQMAIRYRVAGSEFWDSNGGKNYIVGLSVQQPSLTLRYQQRYKE